MEHGMLKQLFVHVLAILKRRPCLYKGSFNSLISCGKYTRTFTCYGFALGLKRYEHSDSSNPLVWIFVLPINDTIGKNKINI